MWAFDAAKDTWRSVAGNVPTGFYVSADIATQQRLILLTTDTRKPGDTRGCNTLYPVRTTYGYKIEAATMLREPASVRQAAMLNAELYGFYGVSVWVADTAWSRERLAR